MVKFSSILIVFNGILLVASSSSSWRCAVKSNESSSIENLFEKKTTCRILLEFRSFENEQMFCFGEKLNLTEPTLDFPSNLNLFAVRIDSCRIQTINDISFLNLTTSNFYRLDLTNSGLKQIFPIGQLKILNLSRNSIEKLDDYLFSTKIDTIDVRWNRISSVENLSKTRFGRVDLFLEGNPLKCDCWFSKLQSSAYLNLVDDDRIDCHRFETEFLCSYLQRCDENCFCCEFEACDCHWICPKGCSCFNEFDWSRNIIRCENLNLTRFHDEIPESSTDLIYRENRLKRIPPSIFIGKSRLKRIDLSRNQLTTIDSRSFCAAQSLNELNLSENKNLRVNLSKFDDIFKCLKKLRLVIMSDEQIFDTTNLSPLWSIEFDGNFATIRRKSKYYSQKVFQSTEENFQNFFLTHFILFLLLAIIFLLISILIFIACSRKTKENISEKIPTNTDETLYEELNSISSDNETHFFREKTPPMLPARPDFFSTKDTF